MKGFYLGSNQFGKRKFRVVSHDVHHLENRNHKWISVYDDYVPRFKFGDSRYIPVMEKYIDIPCGQCLGCRLQKSREWANRMMMEFQYHDKCCFLTLTYDEDHLSYFEGVNYLTGEIESYPGLVKEDLQKFIKNLRNKHRDIKIRYFACGEYGDRNQRPHYHLIIFGYDPDDKKFFRKGRNGDYNYYLSREVADLWPFGIHIISDVSWDTCAYVARYVTKKLTGNQAERYDEKGILPPFVLMSTKPGLGYQYYMDHHDMFRDDIKTYYLGTDKGSLSFSKPRYFKKLDEIEQLQGEAIKGMLPDLTPAEMFERSKKNLDETYKIADDQQMERRLIALSTDLDYYEELIAKEAELQARTRVLRRDL